MDDTPHAAQNPLQAQRGWIHTLSLFMQNWKPSPRIALVTCLLLALCAGLFAPRVEPVGAKPVEVPAKDIVISEIRFHGSSGANDEFIELFNPTTRTINLKDWELRRSNASGVESPHYAFSTDVFLQPGQYYLITHSSYLDTVVGDDTYSSGITDDGGVALLRSDDSIADQFGLSANSKFIEGTPQSPLTSDVDRGYARRNNGCSDSNDNLTDFVLIDPSAPQNSSVILPCLYVTNVDSPNADGEYTTGQIIDIDVTFSNNVNVTGIPLLVLETGMVDRNAFYVPGTDGDTTITFRYTVSDADSSLRLDYVSTTALSLNSGSIIGAVGNALLDLPVPGEPGSLSDDREIQINAAAGSPSILSISRQDPVSTSTNANTLVFRVIFSESVLNVNDADFIITGVTAFPTVIVDQISGSIYDLTVSDSDLSNLNGPVGVNISPSVSIVDLSENPVPAAPEPPIDETYIVDNNAPTVISINQASTQADPTSIQPVLFTIEFSEPIDISTFVSSDITQHSTATATGVSWYISSTSDPKIYKLSSTASGSGTLKPSIPAVPGDGFTDLAGNENVSFVDGDCSAPEPNNCVQLNITGTPTVTINQANGQADPANTLPVNFIVKFSELINTATFTTADITQTGTATGVTWSITNSGDNMTFTLSAVATAGYGTIIPVMAANRVTDLSGNNNDPSSSTDNSVLYRLLPTPSPTRTPTSLFTRSVVINEVAWAGTANSLPDDEWIELYNPGSTAVNLNGWTLRAYDGTPSISLTGVIPPGGYYLLERDDNNTVSDIAADLIYTGALSNSGEILYLRDSSNRTIDTANANGGSWPRGSASTYGSMERIGVSSDTDSVWLTNNGIKRNGKNANGGDILGTPKRSNSPPPTPTPTPAKTSTPTKTVTTVPIDPRPIINEILPRPGYDWNQDGRADVFDEFIEIKNLTAIDINLKGWRLDDEANLGSAPYTLPDLVLSPGERVVFYALETNLLLSDGGDTVRLINPSGKIYDAYTYELAVVEDRSICRLPDGNVFNGWFDDCIPTPNLTNSREGTVPSETDDVNSPACDLPDTLPLDFFLAECRGYGADVWNPSYWDQSGWVDKYFLPAITGKWKSFIE